MPAASVQPQEWERVATHVPCALTGTGRAWPPRPAHVIWAFEVARARSSMALPTKAAPGLNWPARRRADSAPIFVSEPALRITAASSNAGIWIPPPWMANSLKSAVKRRRGDEPPHARKSGRRLERGDLSPLCVGGEIPCVNPGSTFPAMNVRPVACARCSVVSFWCWLV